MNCNGNEMSEMNNMCGVTRVDRVRNEEVHAEENWCYKRVVWSNRAVCVEVV